MKSYIIIGLRYETFDATKSAQVVVMRNNDLSVFGHMTVEFEDINANIARTARI